MLTNQLSVIARLVDDALRKRPCTADEFRTSVLLELQSEADRIKRDFPDILLLTGIKQHVMELHIQAHQKKLLMLLDSVIAALPKKEQQRLNKINPVFEWPDRLKTIHNCLEDLLQFMQLHFMPFMNPNYLIPVFYHVLEEESFKKNLRLIERKLREAAIDPAYWEILKQPLDDLFVVNGGGHTVVYERLMYLKELHDELVKLVSGNSDDLLKRLQELLIYLNFNDPAYYTLLINTMTAEANEFVRISKRELRLCWFRKVIEQLPVKGDTAFIPNKPSLDKQLLDGIKSEIRYVKKEAKSVDASFLPVDLLKHLGFNLLIKQPIERVCYVLQALIEKDSIKEPNMTDFGKFIAYFVTTVDGKEHSGESTRKNFYTKSPAVRKAVLDGLIDLANFIKKRGFALFLITDALLRFVTKNASVTGLTLALLFSGRSRYSRPC